MGASRTWLDLIPVALPAQPGVLAAETDFAALESCYSDANRAIAGIWRTGGRHAFLHHLNAIFGDEASWSSKDA
jgi:hypothetical protein